jgi:hypothetical protein
MRPVSISEPPSDIAAMAVITMLSLIFSLTWNATYCGVGGVS